MHVNLTLATLKRLNSICRRFRHFLWMVIDIVRPAREPMVIHSSILQYSPARRPSPVDDQSILAVLASGQSWPVVNLRTLSSTSGESDVRGAWIGGSVWANISPVWMHCYITRTSINPFRIWCFTSKTNTELYIHAFIAVSDIHIP